MIIFSGNKNLSFIEQSGLDFTLTFSLSSVTGSGNFGFENSITKKNINFHINKNKIYDQKNNLLYLLNKNSDTIISGNLSENLYSIYINNIPLSLNENRENFKINNFYSQYSGGIFSIKDFKLYGTDPVYLVTLPSYFYSGELITGQISNISGNNFIVYGLKLSNNDFHLISSGATGLYAQSQSKNFILSGKNNISNYNRAFLLPFNLSGNFGEENINIRVTGLEKGTPIFDATMYKYSIQNNSTINSVDYYGYTLYFKSINSFGSSNNKTLSVSLNYLSGATGVVPISLTGSGGATLNFIGNITGSGTLNINTNIRVTGDNIFFNIPLATIQRTGEINIQRSQFFYLTGNNSIQNINVLATGQPGNVTGILNTRITGNIISGIINYNNFVSGIGQSGNILNRMSSGYVTSILPTGRIDYRYIYDPNINVIQNINTEYISGFLTGAFSGSYIKKFNNTFEIYTGYFNDDYPSENISGIISIPSVSELRYTGSKDIYLNKNFSYIEIRHSNYNTGDMAVELNITGLDSTGRAFSYRDIITGGL